jgi:prepilin signal peptidase PulO-like enzyme (type II secretory pathway)
MDQYIIYTILVLLGLCLGSFAGASVWRLRARQLEQDKDSGEAIDNDEYKKLHKLTKQTLLNDHSRCLSCSYKLKWYDMMPVLSWVLLGGRCRKCRNFIGWTELLVELSVAGFFVLSYALWPAEMNNGLMVLRFILWLMAGVDLAILFIYDKRWFLLPDMVSLFIIVLGVANSIIVLLSANDKFGVLGGIAGSVLILSGLYYLLFVISKGKWIGFGDIKLGLGLALLLADWKLAFVALFAANLVGCLLVVPSLITKKLKRDSHVPFGPLLIIGAIIAMFFGNFLINYYIDGVMY